MTRAVLLSEFDHRVWRAGFAAGQRPAPLPYGVDELARWGVDFTPCRELRYRLPRKVRDVAEHRAGMPVEATLRAAPGVPSSDFVLALLETQGFFAASLKARRIPPYSRKPLVVMSCWVAERASSGDLSQRKKLVEHLRSADLVTHLSRHETPVLTDLGLDPNRLLAMTYGGSDDYYTPTDQVRDIDILAVGQDGGRDYATLFRAVEGTELRVALVCKSENLKGLTVPEQIDLLGTVTLPDYRALLRRAKVVVVPTKDFLYPTGTSVSLEASACGCAVVVTGTRAMRDYFTDGDNGLLVDVGDVDGWRAALRRALGDDELRAALGSRARAKVESTFNTRVMWGEVATALT
ncbi:MAG: glycosyltransferase family 4 protein, partial [Allobranchiibius sp.]